jgi:S1-C subfamily serine protease
MPPGPALGTGFVVTSRIHVVTAKHVVDGADSAAQQTLQVGFAAPNIDTPELKMRGGFVGVGARVLDVMPEHDLALLELRGAVDLVSNVMFVGQRVPPPVPVTVSSRGIRDGTSLAVSGYPLNEPSLVTNAGVLASSFSLVEEAGQFQERHLGDFTANPGNSGGPVYTTTDGRVVGVCVAGKLTPVVGGVGAHAAGLTVIVPVAEVVALLARNDLTPVTGLSSPVAHSTRRPSRKKKRHAR